MAVQQPQTARIQIIRRIGLCLCALVVLSACSKTDDGAEWLTLSQDAILLPAASDGSATVDVDASAPWTLAAAGEGYRITPVQGPKGRTRVTIRADDENLSPDRRKLGSVRFTLAAAEPLESVAEISQRGRDASQTMLLYMPGQQLLRYYEKNIEGIRKAVDARMPGDGRILVCYQPQPDRATLLEISYDPVRQRCVSEQIAAYDPFRADDPAAVERMFADAAAAAPAKRYGVVIGCHGKAWIPAGSSITSSSRRPGDPIPGDLWTPIPGALQTRAFGDPRRELDIVQLAAALDAQSYRVDWLIFDACFMANIETLYDLRHAVDRIVGAPCEVMGAGFPYDRIMPRLFADQGATCDLRGACYEFWNFYENDWDNVPNNAQSGCLSLAVTAELDGLAEIVRRINDQPLKDYKPEDLQIYEGLSSHLFYDLGHFVQAVCPDAALLSAFEEQMGRAFPTDCRFHTAAFYSAYNGAMNPITHYSGVSVSEPSTRQVTANRATAWYRATHGGE